MWLVNMGLQNPLNQRRCSAKFVICIGVICVAMLCNFLTAAARQGCSIALGLQSKKIRDWQITSSSNEKGYEPYKGRLHGDEVWCSNERQPWVQYIQIRLDKVRHISGIASQGYQTFFGSYWVKQYVLKYSYDGTTWNWYKDGSQIKDIYANTDATSVKRIKLRDTFVARFLRIYPTKYNSDMCMRLELYGCPDNIDCTKMLLSYSDVFSTPNYPSPYPTGIDCTWIINISDKSKQIKAFFKDFDVNNGLSDGCNDDFVQILDGLGDESPSLGKFCNGVDLPIVKSSANQMRIHFHSEVGSIARKGFQLSYNTGEITRTTACTDTTITLDCLSSGKTIKIIHASYRSPPFSSTCGSLASSSSCVSPNSHQIMVTHCEHFKTCNMDVSKSVFGLTSCSPGQVPQLVVYYQCTGTVVRTTPAPTTPTTIPTTTPSTTTTSTTTHPTILTMIATTQAPPVTTVVMTTSMVTPALSIKTEVETITPTVAATKDDDGNKLARESKKDKNGLIIGIVVAVIAVIVIVVIILVCFVYQRRRRQKQKPLGGVVYTVPCNSLNTTTAPTNPMRTSSRGNAYETVNVLYVSADYPRNYHHDEEQEHIYDSPDLQEPLPQMTNNPLYHGFDEVHANTSYEQIDKDKPPPSLDPAIYDSPLPVSSSPNKSATGRSIANPSYDKGVVEILQQGK